MRTSDKAICQRHRPRKNKGLEELVGDAETSSGAFRSASPSSYPTPLEHHYHKANKWSRPTGPRFGARRRPSCLRPTPAIPAMPQPSFEGHARRPNGRCRTHKARPRRGLRHPPHLQAQRRTGLEDDLQRRAEHGQGAKTMIQSRFQAKLGFHHGSSNVPLILPWRPLATCLVRPGRKIVRTSCCSTRDRIPQVASRVSSGRP